jgi:hypothetical protein
MNIAWKLTALLTVLLSGTVLSAKQETKMATKVAPPRVEIAILLDTSGSMQGLLDQAKARLWDIVNTLATARKHGSIPDLRVALYEYGKSSLPAESGWIRQIVPLSDDLDRISTELFALSTNGGDEFCGMAISRAVQELKWSEGDQYRAIFIAGNEPFTQGSLDYRLACKAAIENGITINTLHCGPEAQGRSGKWAHAATLSDGRFFNIDHNKAAPSIRAPQDARIRELNKILNTTYIAYGREGKDRKKLQENVDDKAAGSPGEADVERALSKGSALYRNGAWDLVDALKEGKVKLEEVKEDQLPEEMRKMTLEEKKAHLEKKTKERDAVQKELGKLGEERRGFIEKKLQKDGVQTFSSAVRATLEEQMKAKGFEFKKSR